MPGPLVQDVLLLVIPVQNRLFRRGRGSQCICRRLTFKEHPADRINQNLALPGLVHEHGGIGIAKPCHERPEHRVGKVLFGQKDSDFMKYGDVFRAL